ncbi:MAG TPA: lamin tail domain-containing protein, partial [Clostridia bacterium]|nr:lamin tail domain-containing protein [Clostridia bacterium]
MSTPAFAGLAVTAHNDGVLTTAKFDQVTVSNATPPAPMAFGVYRERWDNLNGSLGNTLVALTNTTFNPNWPNNPSATSTLNTFETEVNSGQNLYGQRVRAFVVPPTNGNYTFWISSDDASELFVSSDENPSHKASVAWVSGWTSSREWGKEVNQQSAPIYLEGGRRYYLEALMQQGNSGDNLAVRWQMPDGTFEEPLAATSTAGTRLIPFQGKEAIPGIYQQTTNLSVMEGGSATLSVLVTNGAPVSYQWRLNGVNLTGANAQKPFYTVSNLSIAVHNGQIYSCFVSNTAGTRASSPITLTVVADTVPPKIVRALNVGTNKVVIVYSKPVELASGTRTGNYVFTNGLAVTGAALDLDNVTVTLTTAPMVYGSNYSLVINSVRDRATTPNTIATNTLVRFTALPYTLQDIGGAAVETVITLVSNGLNVTASGSDVGGYADQFGFSYQMRVGDFDVATRVAGLSPSDVWAKAGLMARETLDAGSRFAATLATPAMNGSFFEWRELASNLSSVSGNLPANYPNTWLRLKRAGNVFTGFASYDGQTWTQLGSVTMTMPNQIYFGYAVSSHVAGETTYAQLRDTLEVTNAVAGVVTNPHEPLGPSSRKTPIVISEIMYKPAPRADTNNLEFVEIYNSNPWFHDISGYRLVGDALSYTFPSGTILPGGAFLIIAASPQNLQTVYGL